MSGENAAISVNEGKLAILHLTAFCFVAQLPNRFNNMEHAACRPGYHNSSGRREYCREGDRRF